MIVAHQHDDIEFNIAPTAMSYRIDGTLVDIPPNRLAGFWAARPHQLIDDAPEDWVHWLTVPLGLFLSWNLPDGLAARMLRGDVVLFSDAPRGAPAVDRFEQWGADLAAANPWTDDIVKLELEAYLRRLDFAPLRADSPGAEKRIPGRSALLAGRMAEFISTRSAEPISVADVARAVHVHPGYAMTAFRTSVGTTIGSYLAQCRVAHAQRLLITTTLPVQEIGLSVGFQSVSQFYDRFGAACGITPGAYRRLHAQNAG